MERTPHGLFRRKQNNLTQPIADHPKYLKAVCIGTAQRPLQRGEHGVTHDTVASPPSRAFARRTVSPKIPANNMKTEGKGEKRKSQRNECVDQERRGRWVSIKVPAINYTLCLIDAQAGPKPSSAGIAEVLVSRRDITFSIAIPMKLTRQ